MARLTLRLNLGSGASLGAVSAVVADLSVLQDLGLRVDAMATRRDAEVSVDRWWREAPGQISERSVRLDERSSAQIRRLLDQRRRDDEFSERLAGAPPEMWFEEWYRWQRRYAGKQGAPRFTPPPFWPSLSQSRLADLAPDIFAQLVADEVSRHLPPVPAVERLTYENPIELILIGVAGVVTSAGFKFGTFTELAKLIRDWSAEKQANQSRAREAAAVADQAEVRVQRERAEVARTEAETRELSARATKAEIEAEIMRRYALQGNRIDDLVDAGLAPRELQAVAQLTAGAVELQIDEQDP